MNEYKMGFAFKCILIDAYNNIRGEKKKWEGTSNSTEQDDETLFVVVIVKIYYK